MIPLSHRQVIRLTTTIVIVGVQALLACPLFAQTYSDRPHIVEHGPPLSSTHSGCTTCGTAMIMGPQGYGCPRCMMGVDCATACGSEARWQDMRPMRFDAYGPGGYAGPSRLQHLAKYHVRPGDEIQIVYLVTRRQDNGEYRLMPGDEVSIESIADKDLDRGTLERGLLIQPDGTITVRLLGQIQAAGLTVQGLRSLLEREYEAFYDEPAIDVTPVRTNTLAEDIRAAVGGLGGFTAQAITVKVMPDGHIRVPGIGGVNVQGLTLEQLKREINLRYAEVVVGLEVEPILTQQAPHFVYVLGQVGAPGRQELSTPTTVMGAIASAGGHLPGGNLRQVVIFRRAEDWRLVSTMLDLNGAIRGKRPTPADEIWLRDGDVVIIPERPIKIFNNFVTQVFTEGIYGIIPFDGF
ncbi:polysaccharide biosynthesis/export family protein [Aporhodopirellula aestuarii]|uniref:Polysaccharide biosynthesis/export family protein n=1 Tax=Aporhodopirellula aestuarii TaxID=2950107 RepID=A0ABT0U3F6_9BACT|nr:polysaccharide biosynthesis/export family protein [Aporhodopirellula aestuarii]MCM2371385.1 polysaccharide biosynthesis/export family protein [Aporhodopirellula aestuarii]